MGDTHKIKIIHNVKSWFFEKTNKIEKLQASQIKDKKGDTNNEYKK